MEKITREKILSIVLQLSNSFNEIIPVVELMKYPKPLYWGGNGVGNRWANKEYNYTVVYSKFPSKTYSENESDKIPIQLLSSFIETNKGPGIIGIYVHSVRTNFQKRPIQKSIQKDITKNSCVVCGTNTGVVCDHKNDLYNDLRVLKIITQTKDDFQPLCNHCNLQKWQICKEEEHNQRLYSAKNISCYRQYSFEFPWEKKAYDKQSVCCKKDTFWYDPIEFNRKIYCYSSCVIPFLREIRNKKIKPVLMKKALSI